MIQISKQPNSARPILMIGLLLVAAVAVGVFWYGPWNEPMRLERMTTLELRHLVDDQPANARAWKVLALRLARDGDAQLAESALRRAFELKPDDKELGLGLAQLLNATHRTDDAFQLLRSLVGTHPEYTPGRVELAKLYQHKGSYHRAAEQLEAAVAKEPRDPENWYLLAQCYVSMQKVAPATQAIARAIALDSKSARYLMLDSRLKLVTGRVGEAVQAARNAVALAPNNLPMVADFVDMLVQQHRTDQEVAEAETLVARIEQIDPNFAAIPSLRGDLESLHRNWESAARYYEKAIAAAPDRDRTYFVLAQTYRYLHRTADADRLQQLYDRRQRLRQQADDLRIAIGDNPGSAKLYTRLAGVEIQLGHLSKAISAMETAVTIDPKSTDLRTRLQLLKRAAAQGPGVPQ